MGRAIVLGLSGLLILATAAGGYFYLTLVRPLDPQPIPQSVLAAEEAIAAPGLFLLGYFDAAYAVRAEQAFFGPDDAGALPAPLSDDIALVHNLHAAGLRPRESLHHVLYGFGAMGEEIGSVAILLGQFQAEPVIAAIERSFDVGRETVGTHHVLRVTILDPDTCGTRTVYAQVADNRVVLTDSPGVLPTVLNRLETARPAELDLTDWRAARAGTVASLGLIVPPLEAADAAAEEPFARAVVGSVPEDALPVRQAYAGLRLSAIPPTVGLSGWIEAQERDWPLEARSTWQQWRTDLADGVGDSIPTLLTLFDRLDIAADGRRLQFALDFDETMGREMRGAFSEAVDLALSGIGFTSRDGAPLGDQMEEETIPADEVPTASAMPGHDQLAAFAGDDGGIHWEAESGPFGLRIKGLRLNAEDASVVEIEVEAVSSDIPEVLLYADAWRRDDVRAELVVTGVLDGNGRNLLRDEPCGPDRNALAAALEGQPRSHLVDDEWVETSYLSGSKAVRLTPGARLEDVASLQGHVRLTLPTGIASRRITLPAAGEIFETDGLRMRFHESAPGELAYVVSGDSSRLLEVRALNSSGDYLADGSSGVQISFSGGSGLLSDLGSRREEKAFRGEAAEVELLIAAGMDVRDYAFTLETIVPPRPERNFFGPDTEPRWVQAMPRSTFDRLTAAELEGEICKGEDPGRRVGPFRLCIGYLSVWSDEFHGGIGLRAPISEWFETTHSAVELVIESILVREDGERTPRALATDGLRNRLYFANLSRFGEPDLQAWQSLSGALAASEDPGDGTAIGIRGRLSLRMPKALREPLALDVISLGSEAGTADGLRLQVTGFEFDHATSVTVDLRGPRTSIAEIIERDAGGMVLGTTDADFEAVEQPESWTLTVDISDRTATLDFILATEHHRQDYPFELAIPE